MDCFIFDRGELPETPLPAPAVVFRLDPVDDCVAELFPGVPGPGAEHVLLQQAVKRLHRGVVAGRANPAHRTLQSVSLEQTGDLSGPELATAIGVADRLLRRAQRNRVADR